jgi:hypothetical protein
MTAITISEEDKKVFKNILGNTDEEKTILNTDVKNLDGNKKILFALYIFEMKLISDSKLRIPAFDCLAALFKGKTSIQENEAAALLNAYAANLWDCEFIGTKAFINQIIKQFPGGGSGDFTGALKNFLKEAGKLSAPGQERSMPMKHYLDDVSQKINAYLAGIKA